MLEPRFLPEVLFRSASKNTSQERRRVAGTTNKEQIFIVCERDPPARLCSLALAAPFTFAAATSTTAAPALDGLMKLLLHILLLNLPLLLLRLWLRKAYPPDATNSRG